VNGGTGSVAERVEQARRRIGEAAARAGRTGVVRLVAVTKGVEPRRMQEAIQAGVDAIGENRAQELLDKAPQMAGADPEWHFVGRLQRNKVASLAPFVTVWQSVDRPELGAALARRAPGARVLVQVNTAGDPAKAGCPPDGAGGLADGLAAAGLRVEGLMTVPALGTDPRPAFAALRELGAWLGLAELSMGMSDDFEVAVEEGATMVRLGRAIFGPRPSAPTV
jgi:pyridoxal phosphate enzyme (YggS family)